MSDRVSAYTIDRDDRLVSVSDSWLEFACENQAPELTRERVVGESLWSFIAGAETRLLFEDVFDHVRTLGEPVALPFRCDSPDRFRFMRLELEAGEQDSIDCKAILVREQARPFYSILDRAFPRTRESLPICSFCKKIYAFQTQWLELEDAIRRLDLFDSAQLPELAQTVCDDCSSGTRRSADGAAA